MSEIDWSKAPRDDAVWVEVLGSGRQLDGGWHYDAGNKWLDFRGNFWPKRCEREGMIRIHRRPEITVWNGEGLPPVGTACEVLYDTHQCIYVPIVVLAHDEAGAVYRFTDGDRKGEYQSEQQEQVCGLPNFRPIRTPEQIAAEERNRAIDLMECTYACGGFEALYDDGWRKTGEGK